MDLKSLSPANFELFVLHLVKAMGFDDPELVSGAGDEGRDIVAYQPANLPGIRLRSRKWVFQCKRVSRLQKADIVAELANHVGSDVDTWVLVATIKPSPSFLKWFQSLGHTPSYRFYVQAWWRHDIEWHAKRYEAELAAKLPTTLSSILTAHEPAAGEQLATVTSRLRAFCTTQIDRYAKGKYIPQLYVDRALEADVLAFLAPEDTIARTLKASALATAEAAIDEVNDRLEDYRKQVAALRADLARIAATPMSRGRRIRDTRRLRADLTAATASLRHFEPTARRLLKQCQRPHELALTLPDDRYAQHTSRYQAFMTAFDDLLRIIDRPMRATRTQANQRPKATARRPAVFLPGYTDRLRARLTSLARSFRPCTLVIARAGGGKTNFVCHLVEYVASRQPTVLLFGKTPLDGSDSLIRHVEHFIGAALPDEREPVVALDCLLEKEASFLVVFLDGINEHRDIPGFDEALLKLLEWSRRHRLKIIATCRDIYWGFFSSTLLEPHLHTVHREELNTFLPREYGSALPLYFEHYSLSCELAKRAKVACHHPLILRFFCEAYGTIGGAHVNLGRVENIRLKELFDVYLDRKTDHIRESLGHRNRDAVLSYLFDLVAFMFQHVTAGVFTSRLKDVTGDADTSTQESLFLRLLDEDIILEERPSDDVYIRRVGFVYEEFMEYLAARVAVTEPQRLGVAAIDDLFPVLRNKLARWINARGVAEYVALMLLTSPRVSRDRAIRFLRLMGRAGGYWSEAFWAVIGKCPEDQLRADIFDEFYSAIGGLTTAGEARASFNVMARYSSGAVTKLAAAILWSASLPPILKWTDLERLFRKDISKLEPLADRLTGMLSRGHRAHVPARVSFGSVLEIVLPLCDQDTKQKIDAALRAHGGPTDRMKPHQIIRVVWSAFPEYQPLLLNGLFSLNVELRVVCADRLRFTRTCVEQVAFLCGRLAEVEKDDRVGRTLRVTADYLRSRRGRAG
jgi:hypothetical protein